MKRIIQLILFLTLIVISLIFHRIYFQEEKKINTQTDIITKEIPGSKGNNLIRDLKYEVKLDNNNEYTINAELGEIIYENGTEKVSMQIVIATLIDRLDQLLLQGRYDEIGDNNIESLLSDLSLLIPGEEYLATAEAYQLYKNKLITALNNRNYQRLNALIKTGDIAFHNYQDAQPILEKSRQLTAAVDALRKYTRALENKPEDAIFPYQEAAIFYQQDIEHLSTKLFLTNNNYLSLLSLDTEITDFSAQFPADFKPVMTLKKQEAEQLMNYANILMVKHSQAKANKLIERSTELLEELEKSNAN